MLGHLVISRHLTFLQCFLYSQESAYHHKDLFNTSVTELLEFYESSFPAVYFEHFTYVSFELSHMPLNMPLEFCCLSLTETALLLWVKRMMGKCCQFLKHNMRFSVASVGDGAVHCGIKMRGDDSVGFCRSCYGLLITFWSYKKCKRKIKILVMFN